MSMTSNKPYLIRAIYEWIIDNELTPYILVNPEYSGVQIPQEYINGNQIVLNISDKACRGLHLGNDRILFTTRFAGESVQVFIVPAAILAIYAKENGRGMEFPAETTDLPPPLPPKPRKVKAPKPNLTLVKKDS